jgi:hypothetical protein
MVYVSGSQLGEIGELNSCDGVHGREGGGTGASTTGLETALFGAALPLALDWAASFALRRDIFRQVVVITGAGVIL